MDTTTTTTTPTPVSTNQNDNDCPRFRPFAASLPNLKLKVRKAKYSTSLDPRGYIPVYEYMINHQPIMWDRETGYVHFTGIWKALGNSKSDIVKMVDSNPELQVKKIRGGFLKIQGTWIPYDFAAILCRRTSYPIRKELTALFGPKFANDALPPGHKEYGSLLLDPQRVNPMARRTMRQHHHHHHQQQQHRKSVDHMSLSRLLNTNEQQQTSSTWSTSSPHTTPSPTLRKSEPSRSLPRIMPVRWHPHQQQQQQPFFSSSSPPPLPPTTPPAPPPSSSTSSSSSSHSSSNSHSQSHSPMDEDKCMTLNQDIIDTINATLLLQRLSQDDGARPFKPMSAHTVPSRVMVGDQEYRICWD
ncbi:transcription regulator HTH, apses-type DNA-binding domain-containing protein [Absidia repens]|uniref:Transcription regulator HTH, apses-type DNA-binding domain-containing protein n=1 Tax=Absidia repens TaxID=90262 RepID=A0A1X2HZQ4_9FUNG|nr:transcription regulator HTH, apses-type DNA-binding domain-containing protein [Absidia repens]